MEKQEKSEKSVTDFNPTIVGIWAINHDICSKCCECIDACSKNLLELKDNLIRIKDRKQCTECGDCVKVCGTGAITLR